MPFTHETAGAASRDRWEPTFAERFYRKVVAAPNNCHAWVGAKNIWGYGRVHRGGKFYSAHRIAFEMANGPIPDGLQCLHRCDVRRCVNPEHLFLGTAKDNSDDMIAKGRAYRLTREQRFFRKVRVDASTGCHIWTGVLRRGEGVFWWGSTNGDMRSAHRASWEMANGPVPEGFCVRHNCGNLACVNPDHLFVGKQPPPCPRPKMSGKSITVFLADAAYDRLQTIARRDRYNFARRAIDRALDDLEPAAVQRSAIGAGSSAAMLGDPSSPTHGE